MMRTMAGPLTVISLFWYGSAHWQVTPSLSLISFTNSHVLYFFISFIFSLFLHSNAANILMFLILIPWYLFSVHILFRLNSDLASLNDAGAIQGMDAREDGVYITYTPVAGADAVTKKLGSSRYKLASNIGTRYVNNIDVKKFAGYEKLTKDNFLFIPLRFVWGSGNDMEDGLHSFGYSYNPTTGTLTVNKFKSWDQEDGGRTPYLTFDIWIIE